MIKYSHGSISASGQERREELAPSPRNAGNSPFPAGIDVQTSYEQMLHYEKIFNHHSQLLWKQKNHIWPSVEEGKGGGEWPTVQNSKAFSLYSNYLQYQSSKIYSEGDKELARVGLSGESFPISRMSSSDAESSPSASFFSSSLKAFLA